MKIVSKNIIKNKRSKDKTDIKWHTVDQTFDKASKKKSFRHAYQEETSRIMFARAIREARAAKKLTQAELAKKVNMPQSVIARLESGNHGVSLDTLSKIAHVIGKQVKLV